MKDTTTHNTCYINTNYFKLKFEKVKHATETETADNFNKWTEIMNKKGIVELDQFYPGNILICPSHSMLLKTILAHNVTRFLTQNPVLVTGEGPEEVVDLV